MATRNKMLTEGTHRCASVEQTWERITPFFNRIGITRVADLTGLDCIGIPVYQAVRPNSRTLAVSQGKGITSLLAKVSAAMEAIEIWHSEQPLEKTIWTSVSFIQSSLPYKLSELPLQQHSLLTNSASFSWVPARTLIGDKQTYLPEASVRLDATHPDLWHNPIFYVSSNGLASGNVLKEALLHAMYELLERHACAQKDDMKEDVYCIDPATVTGTAAELLAKFRNRSVSVNITDLSEIAQVPTFEVLIWSPEHPTCFRGSGTHLDAQVALCRALTEAAQSRLGVIAGARDDIPNEAYGLLHATTKLHNPLKRLNEFLIPMPNKYQKTSSSSLEEDFLQVSEIVSQKASGAVCWTDLTQPDIGIPVVKVVAPGFKSPRDAA